MRFNRSIKSLGGALALAPLASFAAVDAAVTGAITTVGTDLGTVIAALTVVGATILAGVVVYRRFFKV
jgi:hypothetical protein